MRDLLVVGGGPVGLATALYADRAGLDVTVWEPRPGVVDKACGEGLMPQAVAALDDLGVDPPGWELRGIDYVAGGRVARATFRRGSGRGVRRTTLHAALLEAVQARGITVQPRRLADLWTSSTTAVADGQGFGHVIAADGLHSTVRRLVGLEGRTSRVRRFGLRAHVRVEPWTSHVEVHWAPSTEAYVTPVAPDLVGVAVLTETKQPHDVQLAAFPELADRLRGATWERVRGAGPLRQHVRGRVRGRVLLAGDAAGYVDALTGEGIALGLASARAAVDAVVAGDPASYERVWRSVTREHRMLTAGLLSASRIPVVRRALVPAASALPFVFEGIVNVLAGSGSAAAPVGRTA